MQRESISKILQENSDINWYQKFEVINNSGIFTPGWAKVNPEKFFNEIELEVGLLKNKRVLDIGSDAGAYSFFLEDNDSNVFAMDPGDPDKNGFNIIKSIRGSNVNYVRELVYNLNPKEHGYFDIILLINVGPQLKHPLLALEKINSICKKNTILVGNWRCCDSWFTTFALYEFHCC